MGEDRLAAGSEAGEEGVGRLTKCVAIRRLEALGKARAFFEHNFCRRVSVMTEEKKKGEDRAEADELAALTEGLERSFRRIDGARTNLMYFMYGSEGARRLAREGNKPHGHENWYGLLQRMCSVWSPCREEEGLSRAIHHFLRMGIEDLEQLTAAKSYEEARLYDGTLKRLLSPGPSSSDFCSGLTATDLAPICGDRFGGYLERFTQAHAALSSLDQPPAPAPLSGSNGAPAPSHAQA